MRYKKSTTRLFTGLILVFCFIPVLRAQGDIPDKPDMIRVTVDHSDNGVLIQWEPSSDTAVDLYHIYRMNNGTGSRIFSFSSETFEYKHLTSGLVNLAYTVTAEDTLDGSASRESLLEDNEHQAVAVDVQFEPCEPANIINWTEYVGWEGQVSGYRVYGSPEGQTPTLLKFVHSKTRSHTHSGISPDSTYIYYVEAVHTSGLGSKSPIDTIKPVFPDQPSYLTLDYVSVLDRNTIELQFTADVSGEVNSFSILRRGEGGGSYTALETIWNTMQEKHIYQDQVPGVNASYEYLVRSLYKPESCANALEISSSNPAKSIYLSGTLEGEIVSLNWTAYEVFPLGLLSYTVQRMDETGAFQDLYTASPGTTSWNELLQPDEGNLMKGQLNYRIVATGNSEGDSQGISLSNELLLALETDIRVPSAITPASNDINAVFRPLINYAPLEYLLVIYDRGGRKLFETSDPGEGWDGSSRGGERAMEGVYVYYIQYSDYAGRTRNLTGNVSVIYQ